MKELALLRECQSNDEDKIPPPLFKLPNNLRSWVTVFFIKLILARDSVLK